MKQTGLGLNLSHLRTRKRVLLSEMERAAPWRELLALIVPHVPPNATGRPQFPLEALYGTPPYREFAGLGGMRRLLERINTLRFRHLLERHHLAEQFLKTVSEQLAACGFMVASHWRAMTHQFHPAAIISARRFWLCFEYHTMHQVRTDQSVISPADVRR